MLYDENVTFDTEETEEYLKEQCKRFNITHITFEEDSVITQSIVDDFINSILIFRGIKDNPMS